MMHRFSLLFALGAVMLIGTRATAEEPPGLKGESPEALKWNLERLSKAPFKLVKTTPDPQKGQVRFIVEFTRTLKPSELFEWEQHGGPGVFRFLDGDGVGNWTIRPPPEGGFVSGTGARIRVSMP